MKVVLFLILSSNFLFLLMSETLLLGYAQVIGIFALGVFTVIWNNRRKKENLEVKNTVAEVKNTVAEVKGTVDVVHTTINSMRDKELKQTQELGEKTGELKGAQDARNRDREAKIDSVSLPSGSHEPVKVSIEQPKDVPLEVVVAKPADVNIVEDKTKAKK